MAKRKKIEAFDLIRVLAMFVAMFFMLSGAALWYNPSLTVGENTISQI